MGILSGWIPVYCFFPSHLFSPARGGVIYFLRVYHNCSKILKRLVADFFLVRGITSQRNAESFLKGGDIYGGLSEFPTAQCLVTGCVNFAMYFF